MVEWVCGCELCVVCIVCYQNSVWNMQAVSKAWQVRGLKRRCFPLHYNLVEKHSSMHACGC